MGHLNENPGAVAGVGFATARAAVIQVDQNPQGVRDHLVGFFALHVNDETEAASVVFKLRVVKALFRRRGDHGLTVPVIGIVLQVAGHRTAVSLRSSIFYSI
jgi:hypothetical protein